jgi:localization factor PodJL
MQPDLPWNVAGIPSEAREAARASARREGLSVGEWLTRRILRSFSEGSDTDPNMEAWRNETHAYHSGMEDRMASRRETEDMLAHVSRSESETKDTYKRIEEQLRGVARRLDQTERSQSENNRAMGKAAAEMNVAAREQAQAFDQLGSHVVGLSDRLRRIEQQASNDGGMKDAVKGLHQGLSRLADQISNTANQSATQIATLANNIEALAGKVTAVRDEAINTAHSLSERIDAVHGRVAHVENAEAEFQQRAQSFAQLGETLKTLSERFAASEAQTGGAIARLEDAIDRVENSGPDEAAEQRLQGIESRLTDLIGRMDRADNIASENESTQEGLRNLTARLDAMDKRHRETIADLRASVPDSGVNGFASAAPPHAAMSAAGKASEQLLPQMPSMARGPFDPPPFPEYNNPNNIDAGYNTAAAFSGIGTSQMAPPPFAQQADIFAPPPFDAPNAFADSHGFNQTNGFTADQGFDNTGFNTNGQYQPPNNPGTGYSADAFAPQPGTGHGNSSADSYLAAARRSARAAAEASSGAATGGFSWGNSARAANPNANGGGKPTRYVLVGGIILIAAAALLAGIMLTRGFGPGNSASTAETPPATNTLLPSTPQTTPEHSQNMAAQTGAADDDGGATDSVPAATPPTTKTHTAKPQTMIVPPGPTSQQKAAPTSHVDVRNTPNTGANAAPQQQAKTSPMDTLKSAAGAGNSQAQLLLGLDYLDGNGVKTNEAEAARWFERAANQGEPVAAYRLGTLYERGRGVPASAAKAAKWYTAAANQGNRKAMHNMAVAYAEGSGVKKDFAQAAQWFTKAAMLGLADSQFNLAVLYERGMGVKQSLTNAYKWYAIAASQGDKESKARVDALSTQLSASDRAAAQRAASAFKPAPLERAANVAPNLASVIGD